MKREPTGLSVQKDRKVKKGMIFDIKRYAIHDGPGIRTTVFLKGCPLRCQWCHNPEGQLPEREMIWHERRCPPECRECLSHCPQGAIQKKSKVLTIDESTCDGCGKCQEACTYEALEVMGREVSTQEVMREVEKDRIFFENSGGGVTFSGGEPLMQPEFLESLLDACRKRAILTTVDTCGLASPEVVEKICEKVSLFMYDVKLINDRKHRAYTGASNTIILDNLRSLAKRRREVVVRIPLIAGVNDDDDNIRDTVEFLRSAKAIRHIHLLPFHKGGLEKYKRLRRKEPRPHFKPAPRERTQRIKNMFEDYGFSVKVGG